MVLSIILWALFLTSSCVTMRPKSSPYVQEGLASWYGEEFHGRPTSSREIFDMNDLTAAHLTLPFGTLVMVTNLNNNKAVVVRINDRGPFVSDRIIDLSYAAAKLLDAIGAGVIPVRLEVISALSRTTTTPAFYVQVGAFAVKDNALAIYRELKKKYPAVRVYRFVTPQAVYYRVRIKAADRDQAMRLAQVLSEEGRPVLIVVE